MKKCFYLIIFLIFIILPNKVLAQSYSLSLSCPEVVNPSQNIICDVNVNNPDFIINKVTGSYSFSGGIISDQSSLSVDNISIDSSSTISKINLIIPSNALSNDKYTISINSIIANDSIETYSISKTIRVISSDTSLNNVSLSNGSLSYDSSISTYSGIVNDSKTIISASTVDPLSTIKEGTGEKNLNYGKNTFNLVVVSESGISKSYSIVITRVDNRSKNNYLSSLFVTNTNIDFSKTKTEYNLSTTSSEVIISATKEDSKSTISGDIGKKVLNYGVNKFSIKVYAEDGSSKTYNINITRVDNRSDNNYIKSITLSNGSIKYSKTTTTYNVTVDKTLEKIKINAVLDDSKSKFVSGFGPKEVSLNPGNNTVYLKVESENGEIRTYTLNINRDDGRNNDSTLKEITLSEGNIDFEPDKYTYKVNVEYEIDKIKIYATATSDKSKVKIEGNENLKVGKNKFIITVEAENGAKTIYTITVNRKKNGYKLSSNNYIKSLKIKNYDLSFNKKIYNYTLTVNDDILNMDIILDNKTASYEVIGNKNLKNGSIITIKVTAENGDVREYNIEIKRSTNLVIILLIIFTTLLAGTLIYFMILKIKRKNKLSKMYKTKVEVIDDDFIGV